MGLPVWRDPDEVRIKKEREGTVKPDPTAAARSPIRRRSPQAARRRSSYHPSRQPFPPRIERSPPPSIGFNGLRDARRGEHRSVPPVSTLLEAAESTRRQTSEALARSSATIRQVEEDIAQSHPNRGPRGHMISRMEAERRLAVLPGDWEEWTDEDREVWLEDNNIPRYMYPEHSTSAASPRSPDYTLRSNRPQSRDGQRAATQATLPTPPHDESGEPDSLFVPVGPGESTLRRTNSIRRRHPLSRSWRPGSPVNGLGDRIRSPTPPEDWDVMNRTIAPDTTLPSADSSFTSAAASLSFGSNNSASTSITEPDYAGSSNVSRRNSQNEEDSVSSVDPDDLVCDDDELAATAAFAEHVFREEQSTVAGQQRILRHSRALDRDQNRYALFNEDRSVEVGFRLIDEGLDSPEGRLRIFELTQSLNSNVRNNFEDWIFMARRNPESSQINRRRTRGHDNDQSHTETYPSDTRAAVREASEQVHGFFRRFTAEETLTASQRELLRSARTSPPPRYSPPEVTISHDEPEPHPVASLPVSRPISPPSARSERDVTDALLSGDEQDLDAIRRVVERLAQRDDVPEEWWMSMGLNLSRTRARSRSRSATPITQSESARRVRTGRVERERDGSRL